MKTRLTLKDSKKTYKYDQDKTMKPEETVEKFMGRLQNTGLDILEEVVRIDNGRLGIPVYFSVCGKDAKRTIGTKKQMGKGGTIEQAKASAVMELAERFSFFSFVKDLENFQQGTHKDFAKDAVPYDMIMKSVHDETDEAAKLKEIYENLPMRWTWGYNISRDENMLVPFDWFFTINEFNGPSSGNTNEEAIVQGISEIVERHVCSIVSREKIKAPLIELDSADQPLVVEMLEKYKSNGIELYVSDFTLDTGIPTVGVLALDPSTFPETSEIVWTAGTAPDPQKAFSRALTETAQLAGDFNTSSNYLASGLPKFDNIKDAAYIMEPGSSVKISDLPDISDDNIKVEAQNAIDALKQRGFDVILINTRHKDLDIPAFYTIVPGTHFRERAVNTSMGMFLSRLVIANLPVDAALEQLTQMDAIIPGMYYIKFQTGLCRLNMGEIDAALSDFSSALELSPGVEDIPSIYSYIGVCYREKEDYTAALEALQKGEEYDTQRTDIHNMMGFCHFKLKNHEQAITHFKKVIDLDPSSAIDYANIGINYRDLGNKDEAIKFFTTALEIDPTLHFAQENLIRLMK